MIRGTLPFNLSTVLVAAAFALGGTQGSAGQERSYATQTERKDVSAVVANVPVEAMLSIKQTRLRARGNLSLHWEVSREQLKNGEIQVRQFNLVFFDVRQEAITGRAPRVGKKTGVLGMAIPAAGKRPRLRYETQSQTAKGDILVQVHFPQLDELFPPQFVKDRRESDFAVSRTQRGRIRLELKFTEPLDKAVGQAEQAQKAVALAARVSASVEVEPLEDSKVSIPAYGLELRDIRLQLEIAFLRRFEVASRLCLQPVRIRSDAADASPTGAGLAFGMPGANTQWNKADVVFQVRDWMTITDPDLKVATEGAEETEIRASVSVDDCIEIFFVENFDPVSLHGGGATWSSGTANAKIISSDGNATFGVDLTHLAHELGHVLNMGHPGNPGGLFDASTNTLMCPSGWHNDNPRRNSRDNEDNVSNPLLTFTIKLRSPGPECTSSADCGACP